MQNYVGDTYWAAGDEKQLTGRLQLHRNSWGLQGSNSTFSTAMMQTWRRNQLSYYSPLSAASDWTTSLGFSGEQGELVNVVVPHIRTLIRQYVSLITKQRLMAEALAVSEDSKSFYAAQLGRAVANDLIESQDLERKGEMLMEWACVMGSSYVKCCWDTAKGDPYASDGERLLFKGDNHISIHSCRDVYYELGHYDWSDNDWVMVRTTKNRWDLVAQHPDLEDAIKAQPPALQNKQFTDISLMNVFQDDSVIYVYEFYHRPTAALPPGRMTMILEDNTVIYDDKNLYGCIPVVQVKPESVLGTGLGYPLMSSLLPAQEMYDHSVSAQATNQASFAVQSVLVPKGSDISADNIDGLNFISYKPMGADGGGKPEALQLTATPAEVPQFRAQMLADMEANAMLNSAIRGNPQAGVTAGTAIATLSANAQEFLSSAARVYTQMVEQILEIGIKNHVLFAPDTERNISIMGEQNSFIERMFTGKDLAPIRRVKIRLQSPLMNSIAGRTQVADNLLQTGLIKTPQQYFSILEGAPVDTLYDTEVSENAAVQAERDALLEGKPVMPLITDNHPLFIRALQKILYNPEVRVNSPLTQQIMEVIQERIRLEFQCPPEMKAMLRTGQAPQAPQPPPQGQGQQPAPVGMPDEATANIASPAQAPATV